MAHGRRHSRKVHALMVAAWLCDRWIIGLIVILIASPLQPQMHFTTVDETCLYLDRSGWRTTTRLPDRDSCPIIRFRFTH